MRVRVALLVFVVCGFVAATCFLPNRGKAQTLSVALRPDMNRARSVRGLSNSASSRPNAYLSKRAANRRDAELSPASAQFARIFVTTSGPTPASPVVAGTSLSRLLHTAQLSLVSSAGTDEQFADRNQDFIADDRTTFDADGGSFDIAVGKSGTRYEVYSANLNNQLVGVLAVALDTNGDYVSDLSSTFNLRRDFNLRSAAAVVSGVSNAGREFVIVSSSGYYNDADPNDPNNEPSPGIILLVRDPNTGGFDDTKTRELVQSGDNKLFNANALALLPNNDLLVADFHSNELRIVRDTDGDRIPDRLDPVPYYTYRFSDDSPLDIAVNSNGVVYSHSSGNDTPLLAIYDDNHDGRADRDEVAVEGLSIDNNLFLHGLTVDRKGSVYVIEDASSSFDGSGGNGGIARIDVFPDPNQDGVLEDGKIFVTADANDLALSGLSFGPSSDRLSETTFFVREHYLDFLSREPDNSGLAFWINNIDSCGTNSQCRDVKRIDTSAAFFLSIEFQQTGFLVYRLYKTSFPPKTGRPRGLPRFQEFMSDTQAISRDVVVGSPNWEQKLEANTQSFIAGFITRPEFQLNYPAGFSAAEYVDKLNSLSGNALSVTERNALVNGLNGGQETRATVLRKVAEDSDFKAAEFNRAFVLMQYFGYLRRNPDDTPDLDFSGYDFWLGKLNQFGGDYRAAEMVKAFITSGEYRDRFE